MVSLALVIPVKDSPKSEVHHDYEFDTGSTLAKDQQYTAEVSTPIDTFRKTPASEWDLTVTDIPTY